MKKFFSLLLTLLCFSFCFVGCGQTNTINVYMPDGAPALAMAEILNTNEQFNNKVDYNVVPANEISNYILQETADIAILPSNVASKICGSGKKYQAVGICTFGNLYLIGNKQITSLSELKGETIGCIQVQNVPGLTLQHILQKNNISYTLNYNEQSENNVYIKGIEGTDVVALFKANSLNFALVAEPLCTTALNRLNANNVEKLFDIQELYGTNGYPQSLLVMKKSFIQNNPTFVQNFITKMQNNKTWTNSNADKCVNAIQPYLKQGQTASFTANNFNAQVLQNCNIGFMLACENKTFITDYLTNLSSINANSVGNINSEFWFEYEQQN